MDKEKLIELIEEGFSQRKIADELNSSQTNVRHWIKKHSLTKIKKKNKEKKVCPKCKEEKSLKDFYKRSKGSNRESEVGGYCKCCSNKYHSNRVKEVKIRMVEYKSGECERCELKLEDTHYSVFDFHHTDPKEKDPNFDKIKYQKWEVIKNEIDKCKLLCSNCHRETHAEIEGW